MDDAASARPTLLGTFLGGVPSAARFRAPTTPTQQDSELERRQLGVLLREMADALCGDDEEDGAPAAREETETQTHLQVGRRVQLVGLQQQRHLNGELGVVVNHDPPSSRAPTRGRQRYHVRLDNACPIDSAPVSVRAANLVPAPRPLDSGYVLLHSLRRRTDLNGQSGRVIASDQPRRDHSTVELMDGSRVSVANSFTIPLARPDGGGAPGEAQTRGAARGLADTKCCVCFADGTTGMAAAVPCGHACVCAACSHSFARGAPCPVCRAPTEKYIPLFL